MWFHLGVKPIENECYASKMTLSIEIYYCTDDLLEMYQVGTLHFIN